MANKFVKDFESVLDWVGKEFEKGLSETVKYLPSVDKLAALIFPPAAAPLAEATATANLLQIAVASVEQKYAASGAQNGTGTAKAADVLTLAGPAVNTLLSEPQIAGELKSAGITVNPTYVGNLIAAVAGILNVQGAPTASAASGTPVPATGAAS